MVNLTVTKCRAVVRPWGRKGQVKEGDSVRASTMVHDEEYRSDDFEVEKDG